VTLETKAGQLAMSSGQSIRVGRTSNADQALPQDQLISNVQFAATCRFDCCRVIDKQSPNGTCLNGRKLREQEPTLLTNGDEIKSDQQSS